MRRLRQRLKGFAMAFLTMAVCASTFPVGVMAAEPTGGESAARHGAFVEYFNEYDRATDYSEENYTHKPGATADYSQLSKYHDGIPVEIPVTWSGYSDTVYGYYGQGAPEASYDGNNLIGDNYYAVRWTSILTTPDYAGTYYFKINANDGKKFVIYDSDKKVGSYTRWNGTNKQGAVNTGSVNGFNSETDKAEGEVRIVNNDNDVIEVNLEANKSYRIVMEMCEGLVTAFGELQWKYDCTEDEAKNALANGKTDGKSHDAYNVPSENLTVPSEYSTGLIQGYVYNVDGTTPAGNVTVSLGDASYTTGRNGYYRLLGASTGTVTAVSADGTLKGSVEAEGNTDVMSKLVLANADVEMCEVTFVDGNASTKKSIVKGSKVDAPTEPVKDGFVFDGWFLQNSETAFDFEGTTINDSITLTARYHELITRKLNVSVKDSKGSSISEASVDAYDKENSDSAVSSSKTSAEGTAELNVPDGKYTVTVSKAGYSSTSKDVDVSDDNTETVEIILSELPAGSFQTQKWHAVDIDIEGVVPEGSNAYMDTAGKVKAVFTHEGDGKTINVNAFYRDNGKWTIRFTPNATGKWNYTVSYDAADSYVYADAYYGVGNVSFHNAEVPNDVSGQYTSQYKAIFDGRTGSVECTVNSNASMHGGIMQDPDNVQHFINQDGTPFYLMGYEVDWMGLIDADEEDIPHARQLIDNLAAAGYNEVLMNAFGWDTSWCNGIAKTKGSENIAGYDFGPTSVLPWKSSFGVAGNPDLSDATYTEQNRNLIDFTQMNEEYWAKYDKVISYMTEKGVTAHLFWKVYNKDVIWDNAPQGTGNTDLKKVYLSYADTMYARYFRDRYGAYNVVFDMGKESYNLGWYTDSVTSTPPAGEGKAFYIDSMIHEFREGNGYNRIITIHDWDSYYDYLKNNKGSSSNGRYDTMVQMYTDQDHTTTAKNSDGYRPDLELYPYARAKSYKNNFKLIPYYNSETNYQWSNSTRGKTYSDTREHQSPEYCLVDYCNIAMAGAYSAHYYSMHAWDIVKYDEMPEHTKYYTDLTNFITNNNVDGKGVGTSKWASMKSDDSVIGITNAKQENLHAMYNEGKDYLVYVGYGSDSKNVAMPDSIKNGVTISFSNITEPLDGIWFNIMTGEMVPAGTVSENGKKTFALPSFTRTVKEDSGKDMHGSGLSYFLYFTESDDPNATKYTVKFDTDGGTAIDSQLVKENNPVVKPADPEKEGYAFEGWMLDGKTYDFSAKVTGEIELKAVWRELNKVAVTVKVKDSNNADVSDAQINLDGKDAGKSGSNGECEIKDVPEGSHEISVTADAKKPGSQKFKITADDKDKTLTVVLKEQGQETQGLTRYYYKGVKEPYLEYSAFEQVSKENVEEAISFNWGAGAPDGLPADYFAVRYVGKIYIDKDGKYGFGLDCNDGYRLTIDDEVIAEQRDAGMYPKQVEKELTEGYHTFEMYMFERDNSAKMILNWKKPGDGSYTVIPKEAYFLSDEESGQSGSGNNQEEGTVSFKESLSLDKEYDGQAVTVTSDDITTNNTDGKLIVEYKKKGTEDSTYTTVAPSEVGTYTVRVTVAGNDSYTEATAEKDFEIKKKDTEEGGESGNNPGEGEGSGSGSSQSGSGEGSGNESGQPDSGEGSGNGNNPGEGDVKKDTPERIINIKAGIKIVKGTVITITADEFVQNGKTYTPTNWKTNPEGTFTLKEGVVYTTTFDTGKVEKTGDHVFNVIYNNGEKITAIPYVLVADEEENGSSESSESSGSSKNSSNGSSAVVGGNAVSKAKSTVVRFFLVNSNNAALSGAAMELYKGDMPEGTPLMTWTTGETPKDISLASGVYTVHEAFSPMGLESSADVVFAIDDKGNIISDGKIVTGIAMVNFAKGIGQAANTGNTVAVSTSAASTGAGDQHTIATGDDSSMILYGLLALAAAGALGTWIAMKNRKRRMR